MGYISYSSINILFDKIPMADCIEKISQYLTLVRNFAFSVEGYFMEQIFVVLVLSFRKIGSISIQSFL